MTGYFAKLAARATQVDVSAPVSMPWWRVFDPFADGPPALSSPSPTEHAEGGPVTRELEGLAESEGSRTVQPENRPRRSQASEKQKPGAADNSRQSFSGPASQVEPFRGVLQSKPGGERPRPPQSMPIIRQETRNPQASTIGAELFEPDRLSGSPAFRATPKRPDEVKKDSEGEHPSEEEHLMQMEEQSILLRKADDFIQQLTEHLRAPKAAFQEAVEGGSASIPAAARPQEESFRLQMIRSVEPIPERPPVRPSLVIGKLTVEVLPPTPPSTARKQPAQKVVVVRGARWGGSNIHSSRRFGLGQF